MNRGAEAPEFQHCKRWRGRGRERERIRERDREREWEGRRKWEERERAKPCACDEMKRSRSCTGRLIGRRAESG